MYIITCVLFCHFNPKCTRNGFLLMQTGLIQASSRVNWRLARDPTSLLLSLSFTIKNNFRVLNSRRHLKSIFRKLPSIQRLMPCSMPLKFILFIHFIQETESSAPTWFMQTVYPQIQENFNQGTAQQQTGLWICLSPPPCKTTPTLEFFWGFEKNNFKMEGKANLWTKIEEKLYFGTIFDI